MEIRISKLAKYTMPMFVAVAMSGCGSDSDTTPGGGGDNNVDGLYNAQENEVVIYYKRDSDEARNASSYDGWGLHLWNGEGCTSTDLEAMGIASSGTDWNDPMLATGMSNTYGAYYVLKVDPNASDPHECMNFILHKGDEKAFGSANSKVELRNVGDSQGVFGFHGSSQLYYEPIAERPVMIDGQKAHWLDATTIGWESVASADKIELRYDQDNNITMNDDTKLVEGGTVIELSQGSGLSDELKARFPHLADLATADVNLSHEELRKVLKSQIVLVAYKSDGSTLAATQIQKAGVLDAVFADEDAGNAIDEELGAIIEGNDAAFKLWAPTAQYVNVTIYDEELKALATFPMNEDEKTGVWESETLPNVVGKYYRYGVKVYHPTLERLLTLLVTDPYSMSLSANSTHSQVVDLTHDTSLMPDGWGEEGHVRPSVDKDVDHVLYESHLRDFSFSDESGTEALNGKYLALTEEDRESVTHLKALQEAGLTSLHILPAFDIATVDEVNRVDITDTIGDLCKLNLEAAVCGVEDDAAVIEDVLASYDPSTPDAQALMNDLRGLDSFNWGYDPFHYTVPEGSYATDAHGSARIKEFREMVKATHDMELKLIMDVVYNHTNASGDSDKSVLDKIVPGYYHRLNVNTGDVEMSTCCDNTATENLMMGKLMVDSLVVWARDYKVDGFRFDLMGHQPKDLMVEALNAVREVDGNTLFYGEGWDFGEVANNARFEQATQINMAGTEIGTFSDRLRDAVRGGSPFDGGEDTDGLRSLRYNQGFGNAAYVNSEAESKYTSDEMRANHLHNQDIIRVGMAGNLADFVLLDYEGNTQLGKTVDYNGAPAGYTVHPSENISYVSKHDNQTLWDINAYKIDAGTSSADRARMQTVGLSTVMLGQGIPFIHMGSELLRSKSMQRDSYDSGDWFNRVKFNGDDNNWNVGLPREDKDADNWNLIKEIIGDSTAEPSVDDIELTKQQFLELLTIRSSSELFRLESASDVMNRVDFRNVGEDQEQGLIVMSIDNKGFSIDDDYSAIVAVINSTAVEKEFSISDAVNFDLHPVQQQSEDSVVRSASFADKTFTVPALTTAVFVQTDGTGLPVDTSNKDFESIPPYGDEIVYVKGSMNGWSDNEDWAMTFQGNGLYSVTGMLEAGTFEFKFADSSWSHPNIGCDFATQAAGSLELENVNGNCEVTIEETGKYTFTLNASHEHSSDITNPVASVVKAADAPTFGDTALYLRGDVTDSGWGAIETAKFTYVANDVYSLTIDLVAGSFQMKVADDAWSEGTNFGGTGSVVFGEPIDMEEGSNDNLAIEIPANGSYTFHFNAIDKVNPIMTVTAN
ncbi:pullulanase-type alpha-1,6-glucosidase [Vibrio agarivorans]|uniref:pullulanase n=1 Tax=Vibrio agarivorans TaxID=153622 RepID=A0ABT7XYC1_9VIBR|nr:pullulanase-type alpha-1,6-glucosidase [Vibrio agarivorans]MDN2480740.1 pullulanase-type alpha-1,6-glucosidase [Vibrio agarivorans]